MSDDEKSDEPTLENGVDDKESTREPSPVASPRISVRDRIESARETAEDSGELIVIGLGVAAAVAVLYVLYRLNHALPDLPDGVPKGLLDSMLGLPLLDKAKPIGEALVDLPAIELVVSTSKKWWLELFEEGGDQAHGWYFLMGADVYNPEGSFRFAYQALINNSLALSKKHGTFPDYYSKLGPKDQKKLLSDPSEGAETPRLSPFKVRQHLAELPFSGDLYGPFKSSDGGTAASLQEYVWTDYDELPRAFGVERNTQKVIALIDADIARFHTFTAKRDSRAAIILDRIIVYRQLIHQTADGGPDAALRASLKEAGKTIVETAKGLLDAVDKAEKDAAK